MRAILVAMMTAAVACGGGASGPVQAAGETTCPTDTDCSGGLDCEHIEVLDDPNLGACTTRCGGDDDCTSDKRCVEDCSVGLQNSCLDDCTGGGSCPAGYACGFTLALGGGNAEVCMPSGWLDGTRHVLAPAIPPGPGCD